MILNKKQLTTWMDKAWPKSATIDNIGKDARMVAVTIDGEVFEEDFPSPKRPTTFRRLIAYGRVSDEVINWGWIHKNFAPNA